MQIKLAREPTIKETTTILKTAVNSCGRAAHGSALASCPVPARLPINFYHREFVTNIFLTKENKLISGWKYGPCTDLSVDQGRSETKFH